MLDNNNNRNLHILDAVAQLEFMRRVLTCKTSATTTTTTTATATQAGEITTAREATAFYRLQARFIDASHGTGIKTKYAKNS